MDGAVSLTDIIRWEVGDGSSIDLFEQAWLLDKPLSKWPTMVADSAYGITLDHVIKEGRLWNREKLEGIVGPDLVELILKTPIAPTGGDKCVLIKRFSGTSITKLAYLSKVGEVDDRFTWLKRVPLPPKIAVFWWRVIRRAVPTFDWLVARGIGFSGTCVWGCGEEETLDHYLTSCKKLGEVRAFLSAWAFILPVFSSYLECIAFLASSDREKVVLRSMFCMVIYFLWIARNDLRNGRQVDSSRFVASRTVAEVPHLNLPPLSRQWCYQQPSRLLCSSSWCTPPSNWIKVNFDGALLQNYAAGVGIVVRDEFGDIIKVAGRFFVHWDSGEVELEAFYLLDGLFQDGLFVKEGVIIEGDNLNIINSLRKWWRSEEWRRNDRIAPVFEVLARFNSILFSHVSRNGNVVADFCAHEALRRENLFCWESIPEECGELHALLAADLGPVDPG